MLLILQEIPKPQDFSNSFGPTLGAIVIIACFAIFAYFKWGQKASREAVIREPLTGETKPEYWLKILAEIQETAEATRLLIHDFTLTRDKDWGKLNDDLGAIRQRLHDIMDAVSGATAAIQLLREQLKK